MDENPMNQPPVTAKPRFPRYLWGIAAVIVIGVALLLWSLRVVDANADYICTKVVDSSGECANGSWSPWTEVSRSTTNNVTTVTQERIYTGTRTSSKTLTYSSGRTRCAAGYTEQNVGNTWMQTWSGFHGGTIVTQSAVCQIVQTQVTTPSSVRISNSQTDLGPATTETVQAQSLEEILAADQGGGNGIQDLSAEIDANPKLVRSGRTTTVTWSATGVESCAVAGTNGDAWSGLTGSEVSGAIRQQTIYTLTCRLEDGSDVTGSVRVDVIPEFEEQ